MKKRVLSVFMAVCMMAAAVTGCGASENQKTELPEKMVFTYVTAPLNVPSVVEKEKGMFAEEFANMGIEVEYAEIMSGADQTQALASGDVQVLYAVGASSVILSAANGADIKVLNMYSRSPKAFCMYSTDEALSSPDLHGPLMKGQQFSEHMLHRPSLRPEQSIIVFSYLYF